MTIRKKAASKPKPKSKSKEVANWADELAKHAEASAAMEANSGGGSFFSTQGGALAWQDSPLPNNEMAVIILDSVFENIYYEGRYDSDNPSGPVCFAFSRKEDSLEPHVIVREAGQNQIEDLCKNCEHNEWGSADTGRGKACRNTRRLAMIPAGTFTRDGEFEAFEDPDHFAKTEVGFMKLPVTSVKGYASFVRQVSGALKRPPFGIISRVSVVPDPKTQFKVVFETLELVPDNLIAAIMKRREEVEATIDFPYQLDEGESMVASTSKAAKKPAGKKPATKKPRGKKY